MTELFGLGLFGLGLGLGLFGSVFDLRLIMPIVMYTCIDRPSKREERTRNSVVVQHSRLVCAESLFSHNSG